MSIKDEVEEIMSTHVQMQAVQRTDADQIDEDWLPPGTKKKDKVRCNQ